MTHSTENPLKNNKKKLLIPTSLDRTHVPSELTLSSLVIVGANGSGKSRLGFQIEKLNNEKSHRISAQRNLFIPRFTNPAAFSNAENELLYGHKNGQIETKLHARWNYEQPLAEQLNDYQQLLILLFSEESKIAKKFMEASAQSREKLAVPLTRIKKLKSIWMNLLPGIFLDFNDNAVQVILKVRRGEQACRV